MKKRKFVNTAGSIVLAGGVMLGASGCGDLRAESNIHTIKVHAVEYCIKQGCDDVVMKEHVNTTTDNIKARYKTIESLKGNKRLSDKEHITIRQQTLDSHKALHERKMCE